ncbi:MAG: hypothetical protein N2606_05665 [Candidatus Omnitrophica bacterium]|nr:hypothetical protein [Candidatus Omnitrophota bacterium]
MQYIQFRNLMAPFTVFSLADIRQAEPRFDRRRLVEWQDKGYLKKIIKGYYIFADLPVDEKVLFEIANRIYAPSYVSFEMALAYHGLLPESAYTITSASTRKTMRFHTPLGEFVYRTIKPKLYFGFLYLPAHRAACKIATASKALLDYIYLHYELKTADDFAQVRINRDVFLKKVDRKSLAQYSALYDRGSFKKRLKALWEYIGDDRT